MKPSFGTALLLGFVSGVVNILAIPFVFYGGPGALYGVVTGLYFLHAIPTEHKYKSLLSWIVTSTLSFVGGFFTTMATSPSNMFPTPGAVSFGIGGVVGACILAAGFSKIYKKLSVMNIVLIAVLGGATASAVLLFDPYLGNNESHFPILFIVWQAIMTVLVVMSPQAAIAELRSIAAEG